MRGVLEGLARKYVENIGRMEEITGRKVEQLNIVGGGSKNIYLCKLSAQQAGIPVLAGPKEATAIGNILVQAIAMGDVPDYKAGRRLVKESYEVVEYLP
jgi:rhamnulokinase